VSGIEEQYVNMNLPMLLLGMIPVFLLTGIVAVVLYGIPAMVAAAVYLWLKPYKNWCSFLMVVTIGALSAFLWSWSLIEPLEMLRISLMPSLGLGAVTSFIMALLVLPRKTNK